MSMHFIRPQPLAAVLTAIALVLLPVLPTLAREATPEPVLSAEGISEYHLDNGMRVVMFPDSSKPVTTVNVTYLVGARHENYGETGMAHLLEHLVFKGTPTHEDIAGQLRNRGIQYNGTTGLDRTNYFASFATNPGTLEWLLRMEADRMVNSRISGDDLASEMTVVRNEMEMGENNPVGILFSRIQSTAYLWHNYANSTIGARSDVENVPIDRLQAFYRTWYQPDNAVLVVAGDFDPQATLQIVNEAFGAIPRPGRELPRFYTVEPAQDGERTVTVRRVGETSYVAVNYHAPAGRHPDSAAMTVLGRILGHTPTGRLHRALVEGGRAAAVDTGLLAMHDPGAFRAIAVVPADGNLETLETELVSLLEGSSNEPFTDEEVAQAKQQVLTSLEVAMRDPNAIGIALSEAIAMGDWRLFLLNRDRIEQVTAEDVNKVAQAYLRQNNRTVGRFIPAQAPERVEIPAAPAAATLLEGYEGREAMAAGEAFDPSPANIDARTTTFTLDNGAELAVLDKATRGRSVELHMDFHLGAEDSLTDRGRAARLLGAMLMRGTGHLDRSAISQRLTALKSSMSISGTATRQTLVASTDRDNLPALLELAADVLRNPSFPESEFEQLRSQMVTGIRSNMTEPVALAADAMNSHVNTRPPGHPSEYLSLQQQLEVIETLTLDEVREYYRDFLGAGAARIAIVGDVDVDAVHAQVATLFGDWTAPAGYTRILPEFDPVPAVREQLETPDKSNAVLVGVSLVPVGQEHPDHPALVLGNWILGGGSGSRLNDRLRERDGLSYHTSSSFTADATEDDGNFVLLAFAAPENMRAAQSALVEEVTRLVEEGISEQELEEAVDGLLEARRAARASDEQLVGRLATNLHFDRTMADQAKLEDDLRAQTTESVQAALKRHLRAENISLFLAGDFAAAEGKEPTRVEE